MRKQSWPWLVVMIGVLAMAGGARAQDEREKPEDTVTRAVTALKSMRTDTPFVDYVVGADPKAPRRKEIDRELMNLVAVDIAVEFLHTTYNAKGDEALVRCREMFTFALPLFADDVVLANAQIEQVALRLHGDKWQLVPADPAAIARGDHAGIIAKFAACAAYPERMLKAIESLHTRQNLLLLARAMPSFMEDHDDKMPTRAMMEKEFDAYLVVDSKQWKFCYNDKLGGLRRKEIGRPDATVMFYEGKDGALDFRYEGKAYVAMVDGTIHAIAPDEAKALRW